MVAGLRQVGGRGVGDGHAPVLAARAAHGGLMFFILGFVIGFTAGLAIITAQRFGAGRRRAVRRSFAVCIVLSSVMTVLLTAVSVALLTIYDMCKAADRGMTITDVKLLEKHGGKSGSFVAGAA